MNVDQQRLRPSLRTLAGLSAPLLLPLSAFFVHQFVWSIFRSTPEIAAGMVLAGFTTGILLRTAWAALYAPTILGLLWLGVALLLGNDVEGPQRTSTELSIIIAILVGLGPIAAGAFMGGAVAQFVGQLRSPGTHSYLLRRA